MCVCVRVGWVCYHAHGYVRERSQKCFATKFLFVTEIAFYCTGLYCSLSLSEYPIAIFNCKYAPPFDDCTFRIWHHSTKQNGIYISLRRSVFAFDDLDRSTLFYSHRFRVMSDCRVDLLYPKCPTYLDVCVHLLCIVVVYWTAIKSIHRHSISGGEKKKRTERYHNTYSSSRSQ